MFDSDAIIAFIRSLYPGLATVPLHAPVFRGNERKYVLDAIDSTFVSYVGAYVGRFEQMMVKATGAKHAVALVNGTCALQTALLLTGVRPGDLVVTQSLSFVATANAIAHCGAEPVFLDVDEDTLGLAPQALRNYLNAQTITDGKGRKDRLTRRRIAACVPMHTFGHPCRIEELVRVCEEYGIAMVEDATEALGSSRAGKKMGTYGGTGVFSFNGNKTVTSGGGGAIVTDDADLAQAAKHLTTTAKIPHAWEFNHDRVGYNYRMPNLNAALACAQLEQLEAFVEEKRAIAAAYDLFFSSIGLPFFKEPAGGRSNYWLNAILLPDRKERDVFLDETNAKGIQTRPAWNLLCDLVMYRQCPRDELTVARSLAERLVNIPSGVRP